MTAYTFVYTNASGGMVRRTSMQCVSDAEAIRMARDTMQDKYAVLDISAGERAVYSTSQADA